jgi:predicted nicotinamide N-methyase
VQAMSPALSQRDGFTAVNGAPFFEWMADHPDRWATFDRAMAAGGRMHALALAAAVDWSGTESVCDVGGGTGDQLAALLDLLPELQGTVLDLPAVGGDAFERVPDGFDTYLLVNVLHDWDDDAAQRILGCVADAVDTTSRVIVVDNERTNVPRDDIAVCADVLMAALTDGGKERDTSEFTRLARAVGLHHDRSVRLSSGDLAHLFRPGTDT